MAIEKEATAVKRWLGILATDVNYVYLMRGYHHTVKGRRFEYAHKLDILREMREREELRKSDNEKIVVGKDKLEAYRQLACLYQSISNGVEVW